MQTITNKTVTSANSILLVRVKGIVDTWTRIQGFAADDAFGGGKATMAETSMGVDGYQSGGFTPYETPWDIMLQANSPSIPLFDRIINTMDNEQETYAWEIRVEFPSIKKSYEATGFMTEGQPIPQAKKILQPVGFSFKLVVNSRQDI
jgi:hypothetical protein